MEHSALSAIFSSDPFLQGSGIYMKDRKSQQWWVTPGQQQHPDTTRLKHIRAHRDCHGLHKVCMQNPSPVKWTQSLLMSYKAGHSINLSPDKLAAQEVIIKLLCPAQARSFFLTCIFWLLLSDVLKT